MNHIERFAGFEYMPSPAVDVVGATALLNLEISKREEIANTRPISLADIEILTDLSYGKTPTSNPTTMSKRTNTGPRMVADAVRNIKAPNRTAAVYLLYDEGWVVADKPKDAAKVLASLTDSERAVARLIMLGADAPHIKSRLGVEVEQSFELMKSVYQKTGLGEATNQTKRLQLIRRGFEIGLVKPTLGPRKPGQGNLLPHEIYEKKPRVVKTPDGIFTKVFLAPESEKLKKGKKNQKKASFGVGDRLAGPGAIESGPDETDPDMHVDLGFLDR